MNCRQAEFLISNRMDGPLDLKHERALEYHLAGCRRCRQADESFAAIPQDALDLAVLSPWRNLAERAVTQYVRQVRPVRNVRPAIWASGLACAGLLLVTGLWLARPHPDGLRPLETAIVSKPESSHLAPHRMATGPKRESAKGKNQIAPALEKRRIPLPGPGSSAVIALQADKTNAPTQDDLAYINEDPAASFMRWGGIARDDLARLQDQFQRIARTGDDFVKVPIPPIASIDNRSAITAALIAYQRETAVVDPRLARKVNLAAKRTSFEDLCARIKQESGIEISAGRSVSDDKVTVFCREKPIRDLMRQITRVFGYQWRRTGEPGAYSYELIQDLKSQLIEEELRNRDRNEALIALDNEMGKLREYLNQSPEELRKKAESASSPEEKQRLESLATGWGAGNLYFQLGPEQMAALRNGEYLQFSSFPTPGMESLPTGLTNGILRSMGDTRMRVGSDGVGIGPATSYPDGTHPSETPGAFAQAGLQLDRSELGQFTMLGMGGVGVDSKGGRARKNVKLPLATGVSPSVKDPRNATTNAKLAADPALKSRVSIVPVPSGKIEPDTVRSWRDHPLLAAENLEPIVTTADVLEAIHKVSGADVIGDYFTRLYSPETVTARNVTLFEGLNKLCDTMRVKWAREGGWLQFRSTSFFNDRLKEIPNRQLEEWAARRKEQGYLGPHELAEIASLTDAQLNAPGNARAARAFYGLNESWMAFSRQMRPHLRYFAGLSDSVRKAVLAEKGISLGQLPPVQQQRFVSTVLADKNDMGLTLGQVTAAVMQLTFDPKATSDTAVTSDGRPVPSPIQFTYRLPDTDGGEILWKIAPFQNSFNSTGVRSESVVVP